MSPWTTRKVAKRIFMTGPTAGTRHSARRSEAVSCHAPSRSTVAVGFTDAELIRGLVRPVRLPDVDRDAENDHAQDMTLVAVQRGLTPTAICHHGGEVRVGGV